MGQAQQRSITSLSKKIVNWSITVLSLTSRLHAQNVQRSFCSSLNVSFCLPSFSVFANVVDFLMTNIFCKGFNLVILRFSNGNKLVHFRALEQKILRRRSIKIGF